MKIIVGLGNPGKKFSGTRHNVGFDILDLFANKHGIKITKVKFKALIGEGRIGGEKVILVKPQTYMNLSGESVMRICEFYKIDLKDMMVIYDDIDLDVGRIRIRKQGGSGTHNGMRNIIYLLNSKDFTRLRFGIGKPKNQDLADFVLQGFSSDEVELLKVSVDKAMHAIEEYIISDIDLAMNKYNK